MKIDLLFTSHNRLEFTQASLNALLAYTNWELVEKLLLVDDNSHDGTMQLLERAARRAPVTTRLDSRPFGGPVAAMLHAVDYSATGVIAKIDNDVIVCPGWLEAMLKVLEKNDTVDVLGMEPGFGGGLAAVDAQRWAKSARWIGGVGLIRTRIFERRRPSPNGRWFGWTQFQRRYCRPAWISPDLPVFLLDHLPFEPWRSLTAGYVKHGWAREWPSYAPEMSPYWEWWTRR